LLLFLLPLLILLFLLPPLFPYNKKMPPLFLYSLLADLVICGVQAQLDVRFPGFENPVLALSGVAVVVVARWVATAISCTRS
jgi:hypothetical protein